jgi:hypothetical protein
MLKNSQTFTLSGRYLISAFRHFQILSSVTSGCPRYATKNEGFCIRDHSSLRELRRRRREDLEPPLERKCIKPHADAELCSKLDAIQELRN